MSVKSVSSRYSRSLLELAQEQQILEPVYQDVLTLQELMKHRELFVMIKSPVIPNDKKIRVMDELLEGKVNDLTMRFVRLVIKKEREELLPYIADEFVSQYKQVKNISTVNIYSAVELDAKLVESIKAKLRSESMIDGEIEVVQKIDESLVGGFILEFDEYRYDASISWKLTDLRKKNYDKNLYESKIIAR